MTINVRGTLTIREVADATGGTVVHPYNGTIGAVTTDSRDVPHNALFIAIRGDRFDGNAYVMSAMEKGAVCALAEQMPENCPGCVIIVKDTREALGRLAKAYKEKIGPLTVAVTGSVGKTTTKEFIYAVLNEKYRTLKAYGNFNNEIGLPMTLLGLSPQNDAVVLEMGMSASGEISHLSRIAMPDIAVITNIGTSHIGNLGSREAIRDAKLEIRDGLSENGLLILNGDEPLLSGIEGAVYVGFDNPDAHCRIVNVVEGENGTAFDLIVRKEHYEFITIPTQGIHNVLNAAYAWMVGVSVGMGEFEIRRGLMRFKSPGQRQNIYSSNGRTIMDDCYNASPESMQAALKVLHSVAKRKKCRSVAVLGDMLELGDYTEEAHRTVGKAVAGCGIDVLVTFGSSAACIASGATAAGMNIENVYVFEDRSDADALGRALMRITHPTDVILFKASRAVALERAIAYITK